MFLSRNLLAAVLFATLPQLAGCAENHGWTTSLAPPRAPREADCPVVVTSGVAPAGTENLGIERCEYMGFGEKCVDIARRHACAIGGTIVYGEHWETGWRSAYVVGTIGVAPGGRGAR